MFELFLDIHSPLLRADLLQGGSYLHEAWETNTRKRVTCAVKERSPAEKEIQPKMGLEPLICEIVPHTTLLGGD